MSRAIDEQVMIRYLLRELAEDERQEVSERLLEDSSLYSQLMLAEDELVGAYVRNELSEPQRDRFQRYLMVTPEQRSRVQFWRTLVDYLDQNGESSQSAAGSPTFRRIPATVSGVTQHPAATFVAAALFLLSTLGGIWFALDAWRSRATLRQLQSEQESLKGKETQLQQELNEQRKLNAQLDEQKRSSPASLAVGLSPGLVRDLNGPAKVVIPAGTLLLQFRLSLDRADHSVAYRVIVKTTDGTEILSQRVDNPTQTRTRQIVVVDLPARLFAPADYLITLQGTSDDKTFLDAADYYLRIREK